MNKAALSIAGLIFFLVTTLFANASIANIQSSYEIHSSGIIEQAGATGNNQLTVILRGIRIDSLNPNQIDIKEWVDNYVTNHPHATAVTLGDMHQYGVWWYGYSFSKDSGTWMGWKFQQLKTMIDQFHTHGWKVGMESTGIAWNTQQEYNYITTKHPELAFTDANGLRATGVDNSSQKTKNPGYNNVIPDFFAVYETDDVSNNITAGSRVIDIYSSRLTQMIKDGIQWDFWFGTDGWNGLQNQGYYWSTKTASSCYGFSVQEESEFANWEDALLPLNWGDMNQLQRAQAIINNATTLNNWWYYWQIRFAQMYAEIRQAFVNTGRESSFYTIGTVDDSSGPGGVGYLGPYGMYNISLFAQYNAFDYFYTDQEGSVYSGATYALGRDQAYAGALAKMQNPTIKPIIGLQLVDWLGNVYPSWAVKQEYLSQAVNYVWYSGQRYRVCDPSIVMVQYPNTNGWLNWAQSDVTDLFNFIKTTSALLNEATPAWLGPVYPIPSRESGAFGMAWSGMNFSIAQWTWTANLVNNPQYVSQSMGTFLADEALGDGGPTLTGLYDRMVNELWANDKLNIWYYESLGAEWGISTIWPGYEKSASTAFHIQYNPGTSLDYTIPNSLSDNIASSIAGGYEGTSYSNTQMSMFHGMYVPQPGFVTIASFTHDSPNRIAAGYYTNATSGKFLITHMPSGWQSKQVLMPRNIINKMLYWISDCPIDLSEPLIDLKVLTIGEKTIIPMTDQKNVGNSFTIEGDLSTTLNLNGLNLNNPSLYKAYWASNPDNLIIINDWSNVTVTLHGGADTLILALK